MTYIRGYPPISIVIHRCPGYSPISVVIYLYPWLFTYIRSCPSISVVIYLYPWLFISIVVINLYPYMFPQIRGRPVLVFEGVEPVPPGGGGIETYLFVGRSTFFFISTPVLLESSEPRFEVLTGCMHSCFDLFCGPVYRFQLAFDSGRSVVSGFTPTFTSRGPLLFGTVSTRAQGG